MKKVLVLLLVVLIASMSVYAGGASEAESKEATTPKSGGVLIIGSNADALGLVPWEIIGPHASWLASNAIFEPLFNTDSEGNLYPYLLESYSTDVENCTWTFVCRDDVYFQDGTKFDAEALKWNLDNYAHNGIKRASYMSKLDYIEVVDEKTAVMHLTSWDSSFYYSLTRECGYMASPTFYKKYVKDDFTISDEDYAYIKNKATCGTGPFTLDSWELDNCMKLVANKNYWNGDVKLDGIELRKFGDSLTLQAAMVAGEIDLWWGVDAQYVSEWKAANKFNTFWANIPDLGGTVGVVGFDMTDPSDPLSDVRVRKAICYAIDWDAIGSALNYNLYEHCTQMVWKDSAYFNPDVVGYEYNPEKSKELLKEAGYPNGLTTRMIYGTDGYEPMFTAIAAYLAEVGITCNPEPMARAEISACLYDWGTGMYLHGTSMPPSAFVQLGSQFVKGAANAFGANNFIISDDLDAAMRAALSSPDLADSMEETKKAQKILIDDDCMVMPTFYTVSYVAMQDYVHLGTTYSKDFFIDGLNEVWLSK